MNITIDIKEANKRLQDAFKDLSGPECGQAIARAINYTLTKGRTTVKRNVKSQYDIKEADFVSALTVWKANKNYLQGYINASAKPISLSHFNPTFQFTQAGKAQQISLKRSKKEVSKKQIKIKSVTQSGVSFSIQKGQTKNLPFAFLIRGGDTAKPVFASGGYSGNKFLTSKERLPITKLVTTSVFGGTQNDTVQKSNTVDMTADYEKRLLHEINFLTRQIK